MSFSALYQDGKIADERSVTCRVEAATLAICDPENGRAFAHWPQSGLFTMMSRKDALRIGCLGEMQGARLIVEGADNIRNVRVQLPALDRQRAADRRRQMKLIGLATGALVMVVGAYIYGVPLLAGQVVHAISAEWESELGETVADQVGGILGDGMGLIACDPDPDSLANQAITRFRDAALEGVATPFDIRIEVVNSPIANAFALPGGRIYFFEGLLREAQNGEEFAGVVAHEIAHVIHRHSMEQLIASAGTGLLVGFVLGDITGISVAGALGSMLIDNRFSREHELQADRFAHDVADRLGYDATALVDLLDRVAGDDDMARTLALLSTHPLTADRRLALHQGEHRPVGGSAFTPKEWYAISIMCDQEEAD